MLHFLWEAFNVLSQGCSPYAVYRQIAMDTGYAFYQEQAMIIVQQRLIEWIQK